MEEKCTRKHYPLNAHSALREVRDSIGLRVVCNFIDDIYTCIDYIKSWDDVSVYNEKDYITNAKPNGYRSYHMILEITVPDEDYSHFFDRFYREDESHNSKKGGFGIDLSMARELVEAFHGRISISHKGDDIVFTVVLKIAK